MRDLIKSKQHELSELRKLEVHLSKELDELWEECISSVQDAKGVSTKSSSKETVVKDAERQLSLNLM